MRLLFAKAWQALAATIGVSFQINSDSNLASNPPKPNDFVTFSISCANANKLLNTEGFMDSIEANCTQSIVEAFCGIDMNNPNKTFSIRKEDLLGASFFRPKSKKESQIFNSLYESIFTNPDTSTKPDRR